MSSSFLLHIIRSIVRIDDTGYGQHLVAFLLSSLLYLRLSLLQIQAISIISSMLLKHTKGLGLVSICKMQNTLLKHTRGL